MPRERIAAPFQVIPTRAPARGARLPQSFGGTGSSEGRDDPSVPIFSRRLDIRVRWHRPYRVHRLEHETVSGLSMNQQTESGRGHLGSTHYRQTWCDGDLFRRPVRMQDSAAIRAELRARDIHRAHARQPSRVRRGSAMFQLNRRRDVSRSAPVPWPASRRLQAAIEHRVISFLQIESTTMSRKAAREVDWRP